MALAAATGFLTRKGSIAGAAVVVDHGLQQDSSRVARDAASLCARFGLAPVLVRRVRVDRSGGPEAAARSARYEALTQVAHELGASAVMLGHTMDDQAETVLLALARGSGPRSLAGMPAHRGIFRRPLLSLPRSVARAAAVDSLEDLGLGPDRIWSDPHNADPAYLRARVRHEVLPLLADVLGPGVPGALARSAAILAEDALVLEQAADKLFARARCTPAPEPGNLAVAPCDPVGLGAVDVLIALDVATLAAEPTAVRLRALLAAARVAGCPASALSRAHAQAMDEAISRWRGQGPVSLPAGRVVIRRCGRLILGRSTCGTDRS